MWASCWKQHFWIRRYGVFCCRCVFRRVAYLSISTLPPSSQVVAPVQPLGFFASAVSGNGHAYITAQNGFNDFFGAGSGGSQVSSSSINPLLQKFSGDGCADVPGFSCPSGEREAVLVTKTNPFSSGVVCCKSQQCSECSTIRVRMVVAGLTSSMRLLFIRFVYSDGRFHQLGCSMDECAAASAGMWELLPSQWIVGIRWSVSGVSFELNNNENLGAIGTNFLSTLSLPNQETIGTFSGKTTRCDGSNLCIQSIAAVGGLPSQRCYGYGVPCACSHNCGYVGLGNNGCGEACRSCYGIRVPIHGERGTCVNETLRAGASCQPECADRYRVSGPSTCDSQGSLIEATCSPIECDVLGYTGNPANCSCTVGYGPGPVAYSNGTLQGCEILRCAVPTSLLHGGPGTCSSFLNLGSTCVPTCEAGYELVPSLATCVEESLKMPACLPIACNTTGYVGEPAACRCDEGYGPGPVAYSNGTLQGCRQLRCVSLPELEKNGLGDCSAYLHNGSSCQPTCGEGYVASFGLGCLESKLSMPSCMGIACNSEGYTGLPGRCMCKAGFGPGPVTYFNSSLGGCLFLHCRLENQVFPNGPGDCGVYLTNGGSCQPLCGDGFLPSGHAFCFEGKLTIPACEQVSGEGSNIGVVIGGVILAIIILALIAGFIFYCLRRRAGRRVQPKVLEIIRYEEVAL